MKEQIQAAYQPLTYKAIPRMMICSLAMNQANQLNLFPVKGGVSSHYIPHMLLNQTNWDYKKDYTVPFWSYVGVQASNLKTMKSNSNVIRTLVLDFYMLTNLVPVLATSSSCSVPTIANFNLCQTLFNQYKVSSLTLLLYSSLGNFCPTNCPLFR